MIQSRLLRRSAVAVGAATVVAGVWGGAALASTPHATANQPTHATAAVSPDTAKIKAIAAVVGADGSIARAQAGTTVVLPNGSADGNYRVDFKKVITGCVYTATLGTTAAGVSNPGFVTVASDALSSKGVYIQTFNSGGTLTANAFHLVVTC